jgi:hypothetical protein
MRKIFILQSVDVEINERKTCLLGLEAAWVSTFLVVLKSRCRFFPPLFFPFSPSRGVVWLGDYERELVILSILICKDLSHGLEMNRLEVSILGVHRRNAGPFSWLHHSKRTVSGTTQTNRSKVLALDTVPQPIPPWSLTRNLHYSNGEDW